MQNLKLPKNERPVVAYRNERQQHLFELTKQTGSDYYLLYKVIGASLQRLGKGKNPLELEEKYRVLETVRGKI